MGACKRAAVLPAGRFRFSELELLGQPIVLAMGCAEQKHPLGEVRAWLDKVRVLAGHPAVYVTDALASYERRRLIEQKVPSSEWHLLCLPRVTMELYLSSSLGARHLQSRVGFGPSFSHSRLDASGPVADPGLGDQREQPVAILCGRKSSRDPLGPQLHGVLEAQNLFKICPLADFR